MAKGKYATWLEPENLLRLEAWARDGLTLEQIAHNIGCSTSTLREWRTLYPAISAALKRGADVVDIEVENALLKSALGHTVTIRKPIKIRTEHQEVGKEKTVKEQVVYAEEEIYIPPNTISQIFWLKNRLPKKWRDKPVDESGKQPSEIMQSLVALLQSRGGQKP